ncbi:multisubunit Na+/H+ antiporter MnhG subunit [Lysinibacillus parviboronicapiens]|uniref:Multisubunit Na+/H+ antiporter MnhG subunit n=1 Tax=Lysinibacillus parviboronicapiens TaxID=436516 RepID=A0ABV2PP48_9BACI
MKKSFNKLDKIQIVIGSFALLLAILGFVFDNLTEIACILLSISLLVNETRNIRKDKKSIFSYLMIVLAILLFFSSIHKLLY